MAAAWQHNESLASTNGYMFDNNILCDVTLLAGADRHEVKCHRNILASRSPVFYTMFCGSLPEKGLVEIPDVEASVLKIVVRFMYTLEADIKAESVMAVLYAAKKYDVQPLVDRCRTFLTEGLDVDNVCEILEQAFTFSEEQLVNECISFIKDNAPKVLNTDGLLGVSQPVLKLVLEKGYVKFNQLECYKIAKKWTLKQLKADKIEDIDQQHVRDVIGNVMDVIRFSDMQLNVFIENVAKENVLTNSKKVSIIIMINEKLKLFRELNMYRFKEFDSTPWTQNGLEDGISFTVSSPVLLTAVWLYLPVEDGETSGPLEILEGAEIVLTQNVSLKYQYWNRCQNESLSTKIPLQPDKVYSVRHRFQGKHTL